MSGNNSGTKAEPCAQVEVGAHESALTIHRAGVPPERHPWALGTASFKLSDPPRPLEMEHAIEAIENAVMPTACHLAGVERLVFSPAVVELLLGRKASTDEPTVQMSIDEVEALFNAVADVAEGRPAGAVGVRTDQPFVATLLLVREVMHHLGFAMAQAGAVSCCNAA